MTEKTGDQSLESRLIGWKRIASYLGCSERTARRWEREEQLPVRRQPHEKRSTVFALPTELDAWLGSRANLAPAAEAPTGSGRMRNNRFAMAAFAATAIVAVAIVATWPRTSMDEPGAARDPIAVDLYERGTALWRQRGEVPNQQAVKLLTQAVERDETYAEAWAALSSAWLTLPSYSDEISATTSIDEALLAADRALQLDPTLVEARSVMASVARGRGDWLTSERIFRDALDVDPNNTSLMLWFAGHYRELGLIDKATAMTDAALQLEPNSPPLLTEAAMNLYQLGHVEEAANRLDYLWFDLGIETPIVWTGRWFALLENEDFDAARSWLEESPFAAFDSPLEAYIAFRENDDSDVRLFVTKVKNAYDSGMPGWLAYHLLDRAGSSASALEILDRESADGYFNTSVVLFFEYGGDTRKREAFAGYLERLGFYEYWRSEGHPDMCRHDLESAVCQRLSARAIEE